MLLFFLCTIAAVAAATGSVLLQAPTAQAQAGRGPVAYSTADQKYVGLPCTPATPKADTAQSSPCGPIAYSTADQNYVGLPCTSPTPKAEAGKAAPCGPVAY